MIEAIETRASTVVTETRADIDHGLRNLGRWAFFRGSGILSDEMSSFEDPIKTALVVVDRLFSACPSRGPDSFQFVLLGREALAVKGILSTLFRRSSSRDAWLVFVSERRVAVERIAILRSSTQERPPASLTGAGSARSAFDRGSPSSSAAAADGRLGI